MKIFGLPGTSFSPRRALGVDVIKRNIAKATGVPPPPPLTGYYIRKWLYITVFLT